MQSYSSSKNQPCGGSINYRNNTQPTVFTCQSPPVALQPPHSSSTIPRLMSSSSSASVYQPTPELSSRSTSSVLCQLCSGEGNAACSRLSFLKSGSVLGGAVSNLPLLNPSKSFLPYATLSITNVSLRTRLHTGASAICISFNVLQRLSNFRYVDGTPRSLILADKRILVFTSIFFLPIFLIYIILTKCLYSC
jgi:hypothetical protein